MKTIITLILLSFNLQARDCYNEDGGAAEKCFEALAHLELINSSSKDEMEILDRSYCMQISSEAEDCVYEKDIK